MYCSILVTEERMCCIIPPLNLASTVVRPPSDQTTMPVFHVFIFHVFSFSNGVWWVRVRVNKSSCSKFSLSSLWVPGSWATYLTISPTSWIEICKKCLMVVITIMQIKMEESEALKYRLLDSYSLAKIRFQMFWESSLTSLPWDILVLFRWPLSFPRVVSVLAVDMTRVAQWETRHGLL